MDALQGASGGSSAYSEPHRTRIWGAQPMPGYWGPVTGLRTGRAPIRTGGAGGPADSGRLLWGATEEGGDVGGEFPGRD